MLSFPMCVLIIITDFQQTPERWGIIFYAIIAILILELVVYSLFGSGEEQAWNKLKPPAVESGSQDTTDNMKY